jgi:ribose transport system permease protein
MAVAIGLTVGAVNGLLVAYFRLQSVTSTLATMIICSGLALVVRNVSGGTVPDFMVNQLTDTVAGRIPVAALIVIGVVLFWSVIRRTNWGVALYAVGGDETAAAYSGISIRRVKLVAYCLAGVFYGLAGYMLSSVTATGNPAAGNSYLLPVFAAIAIGGTAFSGGRGGMIGSMVGAATLAMLQKVLFSVGVMSFYTDIVQGFLIIVAVLIGALSLRLSGEFEMGTAPQLAQEARTRTSLRAREGAVEQTQSQEPGSIELKFGYELWTALALFAMTALLILGSRWISPSFGTWNQTKAILLLSSFIMVAGFGQQMVILIGGLDLSAASVITLGGLLTFIWIGASSSALIWGVPAVLLLMALVGAVNGIGVALLRIPPFIMTLAMGMIIYGAVLGITKGTPLGESSPLLTALFTGHWFGLPPLIYHMMAIIFLCVLVQRRTAFGRRVYAIGTNPYAAYLAGLPVRLVTIWCYAISGGAAGVAGILLVGYSGGATLTLGQSYLMPCLAAVVIGGTSILGGRGHYLGVVGGAALLTTFSTIVSALGVEEGWRIIIYGVVILAALLVLREEVQAWVGRLHHVSAPVWLIKFKFTRREQKYEPK